MALNPLQASIYQGYGTSAQALGAQTFNVIRGAAGASNPLTTGTVITALPAAFTSGMLAGNNFSRAYGWDDAALAGLFDGTLCQPGDYLQGQADGSIYIVMAMEPFLPILCVQANRTGTQTRSLTELPTEGGAGSPAQTGGLVPYWGRVPSDTTVGLTAPIFTMASGGHAAARSDQPSAAPGPTRWRIFLSPGTFPKGSVRDRDFITDEEGNRDMVEAAAWTNQGYRLETIRDMF